MAARKSNPLNDPRNIERIAELHPELQSLANQHITNCWELHTIYIRVTQGLRNWKAQDDLYALGRIRPGKIVTNAKGGQSWHNFGLSYDVVPLDMKGNPIWNTDSPVWANIQLEGLRLGLKQIQIKSKGKLWTDIPHFEWHPYLDIKMAAKLYKKAMGNMDSFYNAVTEFIKTEEAKKNA